MPSWAAGRAMGHDVGEISQRTALLWAPPCRVPILPSMALVVPKGGTGAGMAVGVVYLYFANYWAGHAWNGDSVAAQPVGDP